MRRIFNYLCVALLLFGTVGAAEGTIIDFDDIVIETSPASDAWAVLPADYKGLNWIGVWEVANDALFSTFNNSYGSPSGENAAYNDSGALTVSISSGALLDFEGANFTGWGQNDQPQVGFTSTSVTVTGYNNGVPVGSPVTMSLSTTGYTWLQADLVGVDELVFTASAEGAWFLMDDFTYSVAVPEPATMLLLGAGLVGLAGFGRKRLFK